MNRLELTAIPDAPLHFGNRQNTGNYAYTLDYIPGTALRGAIAMGYLQRDDLKAEVAQTLEAIGWSFQDYFDFLFTSGKVCFPNLYPKQEATKAPFVIPLSARTCKRFDGFSNDTDDPHGVCDLLLHEPHPFRCVYQPLDRPICDAPMEPLVGFYQSDDGSVLGASSVNAPRRTLTRTAIENETETVEQGILYSLEAIEEGSGSSHSFTGDLRVDRPEQLPPPHQDVPLDLLNSHLDDQFSVLQLGAAKTRGLGTVHLDFFPEPISPLPPLEERFDALQQTWAKVGEDVPDETIFTLTLNSDAIVLDELWRYCSVLDECLLAREVDGAPQCCLKRWFTDTRIVSGFNSAHRLPKEDELAILKGAAFLYTTTTDRSALLAWLQAVETHGIGERRSEGFGHVIACHPFHWEVRTP
jgi:CRISPR-associated protein Csx10